MDKGILKEIGLTDGEIKVYLALLELGDSTRGDIVQEAGISGSKVYEILERLQEKGLVSIYLKDKIKHFKPISPKQILNYLDEKKMQIKDVESQVNSILPDLLSKFNSSKEDQEVELMSGLKGLEIIFREQVDLLSKGEVCYVIGGSRSSDSEPVEDFFQKIHVLREKKGIKTKMLYNMIEKNKVSDLYSSKKYPGTSTRYIEHSSPVAINVFKDRTVIIIFGKKISSISIKSSDVANSFMEYFNLLWKNAKN